MLVMLHKFELFYLMIMLYFLVVLCYSFEKLLWKLELWYKGTELVVVKVIKKWGNGKFYVSDMCGHSVFLCSR